MSIKVTVSEKDYALYNSLQKLFVCLLLFVPETLLYAWLLWIVVGWFGPMVHPDLHLTVHQCVAIRALVMSLTLMGKKISDDEEATAGDVAAAMFSRALVYTVLTFVFFGLLHLLVH